MRFLLSAANRLTTVLLPIPPIPVTYTQGLFSSASQSARNCSSSDLPTIFSAPNTVPDLTYIFDSSASAYSLSSTSASSCIL